MNLSKYDQKPPLFQQRLNCVKKNTNSQIISLKWKQNKNRFLTSLVIHYPPFFSFFLKIFSNKNCQRTYKEIIAFLPFLPSLRNSKKMLYILFTTMQTKCTDFVLPRNKPKSVVKFSNCHIDQPRPGCVKFHLWFSYLLLKSYNLWFKWWGFQKN